MGKFPLPVEVIPMARAHVARELAKLGGEPVLRAGFTTDNGNLILDVKGLAITDPKALETRINAIVGVVTNGLFALRGADVALLAGADGVKTLKQYDSASKTAAVSQRISPHRTFRISRAALHRLKLDAAPAHLRGFFRPP